MANVLLEPSFRHRENLDGSWDSICLQCYATAAHSHGEWLLAEAEQGHCCDEARWFFRQPLLPRRHDGRPADLRESGACGTARLIRRRWFPGTQAVFKNREL